MIGDILSPTHLLFILVVALLVLGPKRLPEAGRALGRGIRDFRTAIGGEEDHHTELSHQPPASPLQAMTQPSESTQYAQATAYAQSTPYTQPTPDAQSSSYTEPTPYTETTAPPKPPVDHAIQAAVYAATPAVDATPAEDPTPSSADAAEHPDESSHSV